MTRRSAYVNDPLTWSIPGGHVEPGESFLGGAVREAWEEIGVDLTGVPHALIHISRSDWPLAIYRIYAFSVPKRFEPTLNWENDQHLWCKLEDLPGPLHWGMDQLLSNDRAGLRLKRWLDSAVG